MHCSSLSSLVAHDGNTVTAANASSATSKILRNSNMFMFESPNVVTSLIIIFYSPVIITNAIMISAVRLTRYHNCPGWVQRSMQFQSPSAQSQSSLLEEPLLDSSGGGASSVEEQAGNIITAANASRVARIILRNSSMFMIYILLY